MEEPRIDMATMEPKAATTRITTAMRSLRCSAVRSTC